MPCRRDQIKILSGGAMRRLLIEAVPLFERASGAKVAIAFGLTRVLKKEIEEGAAFDIALLPRPELDALVAGGQDRGRHADRHRALAVGFAVRAGAPKPDIGTVDALQADVAAGAIDRLQRRPERRLYRRAFGAPRYRAGDEAEDQV